MGRLHQEGQQDIIGSECHHLPSPKKNQRWYIRDESGEGRGEEGKRGRGKEEGERATYHGGHD